MIEIIKEAIQPIDLIKFLKGQDTFPKYYWKDRESNEERCGWGSLHQIHETPSSCLMQSGVHYFGAVPFPENEIKNGTAPFFFIPKCEIIQNNQKTELWTYRYVSEKDDVTKINWNESSLDLTTPACISKSHTPCFFNWYKTVNIALEAIDQKRLKKVVLARKTSLDFSNVVDPFVILHNLLKKQLNTSIFFLQFSVDKSFLGSSPEKLYTRSFNKLQTEALAGTVLRSKDKAEDLSLQKELLSSVKDHLEVSLVEEFISQSLSQVSSSIHQDEHFTILPTPKVQHLYKKIFAELENDMTDEKIIEILHPTPAVAGLPKNTALSFIEDHELFSRGLYAGIIGFISKEKANFCVGIRSAIIEDNKVHLYAGTGIVKGSDPEKEWSELNNKISQYEDIFHEFTNGNFK